MKALPLILALFATEATALSCMQPSIADSFARAEEIPEDVYLLRGTLSFDRSLMPKGVVNEERDPDPVPAYFRGFALSPDGFTTPYDRALTIQPLCLGPWCGSAAPDEEAVMFATVKGNDLVIEVSPCGGQIFYGEVDRFAREAEDCMKGGCLP